MMIWVVTLVFLIPPPLVREDRVVQVVHALGIIEIVAKFLCTLGLLLYLLVYWRVLSLGFSQKGLRRCL